MTTRTLTVTTEERGPGRHTTIVESPWSEALAVIDGLATATGNATYRGVQFGRKRQQELTVYLRVDRCSPEWAAIAATGRGQYTFDNSYLDLILAAAAKIETAIAGAKLAPATYSCAAQRGGCGNRVTTRGAYCTHCAHDA